MSGKWTKDFWQTKKHLASAILGVSGWNMHQFDGKIAAGRQVFVYVYDSPSEFLWMASVSLDEFVRISEFSHFHQNEAQLVRDELSRMLFDVASGNPPAAVNGFEWESQLGALLVSYAGTTRTWEAADRLRNGGHFIVLNYRAATSNGKSSLRPFVIAKAGNVVLPVDDLKNHIKQVVKYDQEKHPECFS